MKRFLLGGAVFPVALLLLAATTSRAQSGGVLKGVVMDEHDESMRLRTVKVTLLGTERSAQTNDDGNYVIEGVPAGAYRVSFELAGYLKTVEKVSLSDGKTTEVNVKLRLGFSAEVTVTARRDVTRLQDVPENVAVLTDKELRIIPSVNIVGALNNVAGVDVETGTGLTAPGTFMYINGYDDVYIRKMVDGVDVGQVVTNWSMLNSYPEEMLEQIEMIKGGSSAAWGSNMAGIINLVTKRPRGLERPVINLRSTLGWFGEMDFGEGDAVPNSGNMQRYSANIMGNRGAFYYLAGVKHDEFDGFTDFSAERTTSVFTKLGYEFNKDSALDVLFNYNKLKNQFHSFLSFADLPPGLFLWDYTDDVNTHAEVLSVKYSNWIRPKLQLEAQFKFNEWNYDNHREQLEDQVSSPPGEEITSTADRKLGFTVKSVYRPQKDLSVVSGLDYYRVKADFTHFIANQPLIFVNEVAPFANLEYRKGQVGVHAGARYDYDSSFGSQLSPTFGVNVNVLPNSVARFNVSRTFRVPPLWYTLGESYFDLILPNPDLKPERAWAYAVGVESQELHYLYVKLAGYYHAGTDGIVRVSADQPGRFTWGNTDEFTRKGYEAELGVITKVGITGYVGTNYNRHENSTKGQVIDWIPTRTYKVGLKYQNDRWDFMANLRGRWIWWNESEDIKALFFPRDEKWIFDLKLAKGFAVSKSVRLGVFADIFNLSDQLYWDRKDQPNPRRWAQFGVELGLR